MPIMPLPQFEADLEQDRRDAEEYARLSIPKTMVVRFGLMKLIGEFPYDGSAKPGCGSKIVVRTPRGTELGEMLTSTCPNAGCAKSVSRQEMLEYIENSGGQDYPFFTDGRVLRVATIEDMNEQSRLDALRPKMVRYAREQAAYVNLPMKIVDAEPILGGDRLTFYFAAEDRIDFRDLVTELSHEFKTRIELRQVGARDEARLTADYEKCGQHCCCKQFLKVLKPVSIKSAKVQKATLDPMKISGRCGRLMCCLRYEDSTYDELVKRLPKMKKRVGTAQGVGIVVDRQILTQLVLVKLEADGTEIAVPVEEIIAPEAVTAQPAADPLRGMPAREVERRTQGPRQGPPPAPADPGVPGAPGQQNRNAGPSDRQRDFRDRSRQEQQPRQPRPTDPGAPRQQQRPPQQQPPRQQPPVQPNQGAPGTPGIPGASGSGTLQGQGGGGRRKRRRKKGGGGGSAFGGGGPAFGG